jgi:hypothetical protein
VRTRTAAASLTERANRHGPDAEHMTDGDETEYPQSKIRVTRRG